MRWKLKNRMATSPIDALARRRILTPEARFPLVRTVAHTLWVRTSPRRVGPAVAAFCALCLALSACTHASVHTRATARRSAASSTTASTAATTTTSTTARTTTSAKPLPGLGVGARGPQVLALEQRLSELHYDVGAVDGVYDSTTAFAVTAFQKVTGMARTGRATDDVLAAVTGATDPPALVPGGGATRVEVDVPRQVLFLYRGNALFKILPVSTGSGARY